MKSFIVTFLFINISFKGVDVYGEFDVKLSYLLYLLLYDTEEERYEELSLYLVFGLFDGPVLSRVVTLNTLWFVVEYKLEGLYGLLELYYLSYLL